MRREILFVLLILGLLVPGFAAPPNPPADISPTILLLTNDTIKIQWGANGNPPETLYRLLVGFDENFADFEIYGPFAQLDYSLESIAPNSKRCFQAQSEDPGTGEHTDYVDLNAGRCVYTLANEPRDLEPLHLADLGTEFCSISNKFECTASIDLNDPLSSIKICDVNPETLMGICRTPEEFAENLLSPVARQTLTNECGLIDNIAYYCPVGKVCDFAFGTRGNCVDAQQLATCYAYDSCNSALNVVPAVPEVAQCLIGNPTQYYKIELNSSCKLTWVLNGAPDVFTLKARWSTNVCGGNAECTGSNQLLGLSVPNTKICSSPQALQPGTYYAWVFKTGGSGAYTLTATVDCSAPKGLVDTIIKNLFSSVGFFATFIY